MKISEADTAIDTLEQEHQITERDLNTQIAQVQRSSQELNVNVDKLKADNRTIERYANPTFATPDRYRVFPGT